MGVKDYQTKSKEFEAIHRKIKTNVEQLIIKKEGSELKVMFSN